MATKKTTAPQTKPMSIDAGTGRIVSTAYAKSHPKTTVTMTVPVGKPSSSSKAKK